MTHAVCVGMTGSGKTGLGIGLIEEAAIDGVPVLAIDPKGDLANLLLTFPSLAPADFRPWVDPADAAARGLTPDQLAEQQAATWQKGLADWDQTPARIAKLKDTAAVRVLTPGSRAGTPLALLRSLRPPDGEGDEDARTRITSTAASLLALAGYAEMGPHDRELTFLSAVLASAASAASADLPWLVQQIQRPSFDRVGVLDLETYYPAKERQDLALRFNSVLASPGFDVWLDGVPLDVGAMLHDASGRPTVTVISIAHLGDAERMLVVSLVLNALLEWTRRQTGTGSLRAMLYMDEVFGYLPPVANPPSKPPLLTLLKQARAFGVGIVLATQNPVDLDYKALSNTGTWFLGKLQTERDKSRVLDGLEGVTGGFDRATLDKTLSALRSRVFLMHNVHEAAPVVFETRWTLSYLRGPMGRDEIKRALGGSAPATASAAPGALRRAPAAAAPAATAPARAAAAASGKPVLPASVREFYLPATGTVTQLTPVLYGAARVHYTDTKRNIDTVQDLQVTVPFSDGAVAIDWDRAEPHDSTPDDLAGAPRAADGPLSYGPLPPAGRDAKSYVGVDPRLRAVDHPCRAPDALLGAVGEADVAGRRERARLPAPRAAGVARDARRGGAEAARQLRVEGRPADAARADRRGRGHPRRAAGHRAEDADDGVDGRHRPGRSLRAQGHLALEPRTGHDGGARCRTSDQGVRGHRARPDEAAGSRGRVEGARGRDRRRDCGAERRRRRGQHRDDRDQAEAGRRGRAARGARVAAGLKPRCDRLKAKG